MKARREKKYSEMQKSVKEEKISPFISPRKTKSRLSNQVQYGSTARGSESRSTVGIKSHFKIQTNGRDLDEMKRRIP